MEKSLYDQKPFSNIPLFRYLGPEYFTELKNRESRGHGNMAVSKSNAMGPFQIKEVALQELKNRYKELGHISKEALFDPGTSLKLASLYLDHIGDSMKPVLGKDKNPDPGLILAGYRLGPSYVTKILKTLPEDQRTWMGFRRHLSESGDMDDSQKTSVLKYLDTILMSAADPQSRDNKAYNTELKRAQSHPFFFYQTGNRVPDLGGGRSEHADGPDNSEDKNNLGDLLGRFKSLTGGIGSVMGTAGIANGDPTMGVVGSALSGFATAGLPGAVVQGGMGLISAYQNKANEELAMLESEEALRRSKSVGMDKGFDGYNQTLYQKGGPIKRRLHVIGNSNAKIYDDKKLMDLYHNVMPDDPQFKHIDNTLDVLWNLEPNSILPRVYTTPIRKNSFRLRNLIRESVLPPNYYDDIELLGDKKDALTADKYAEIYGEPKSTFETEYNRLSPELKKHYRDISYTAIDKQPQELEKILSGLSKDDQIMIMDHVGGKMLGIPMKQLSEIFKTHYPKDNKNPCLWGACDGATILPEFSNDSGINAIGTYLDQWKGGDPKKDNLINILFPDKTNRRLYKSDGSTEKLQLGTGLRKLLSMANKYGIAKNEIKKAIKTQYDNPEDFKHIINQVTDRDQRVFLNKLRNFSPEIASRYGLNKKYSEDVVSGLRTTVNDEFIKYLNQPQTRRRIFLDKGLRSEEINRGIEKVVDTKLGFGYHEDSLGFFSSKANQIGLTPITDLNIGPYKKDPILWHEYTHAAQQAFDPNSHKITPEFLSHKDKMFFANPKIRSDRRHYLTDPLEPQAWFNHMRYEIDPKNPGAVIDKSDLNIYYKENKKIPGKTDFIDLIKDKDQYLEYYNNLFQAGGSTEKLQLGSALRKAFSNRFLKSIILDEGEHLPINPSKYSFSEDIWPKKLNETVQLLDWQTNPNYNSSLIYGKGSIELAPYSLPYMHSPYVKEKFLSAAMASPSKNRKGGIIEGVNQTGYTPGTDSFENDVNVIPSNIITMKDTPFDVLGIPNKGRAKLMKAGLRKIVFPGADYVTEIPIKQSGGRLRNPYIKEGFQARTADGHYLEPNNFRIRPSTLELNDITKIPDRFSTPDTFPNDVNFNRHVNMSDEQHKYLQDEYAKLKGMYVETARTPAFDPNEQFILDQDNARQLDYTLLKNRFGIKQTGGKLLDVNSQEYKDLYNSGKLMSYDKNTDTYSATPLKEVVITAERPQWAKDKMQFEKEYTKDMFIDESMPKWSRSMGISATNMNPNNIAEYDKRINDKVVENIFKRKPTFDTDYSNDRLKTLQGFTQKELELIKNSKYASKIEPSIWSKFEQGLLSVGNAGSPVTFKNENLTQEEAKKEDNPLNILQPLNIPSKMVQSAYKKDYSLKDALKGKQNNAGIVEDIVTDPLNLVGAGLVGKLSKADKVIDATKVGGKVLNKTDDAVNNINRIKFDDFKNDNEFFRIIVGDEAFDDIVQTQKIRTKQPSSVKNTSPNTINLDRRGSTAFPSFSKGSPSLSYANDNPNHYIIRTADESIKPSTSGRHGKGTTMFPTDKSGKHLTELDASKVQVYKHVGNGEYELVNTAKPIISSVDDVVKNLPKLEQVPLDFSIEDILKNISSTERKNMEIVKKGNAYFKELDNPESLKRLKDFEDIDKRQTGGNINTTGYTPGTDSFDNDVNIIPSNIITMKNTPFDVLGIPNKGRAKLMKAGLRKIVFPNADYVTEIPMAQIGGRLRNPYIKEGFQARTADGHYLEPNNFMVRPSTLELDNYTKIPGRFSTPDTYPNDINYNRHTNMSDEQHKYLQDAYAKLKGMYVETAKTPAFNPLEQSMYDQDNARQLDYTLLKNRYGIKQTGSYVDPNKPIVVPRDNTTVNTVLPLKSTESEELSRLHRDIYKPNKYGYTIPDPSKATIDQKVLDSMLVEHGDGPSISLQKDKNYRSSYRSENNTIKVPKPDSTQDLQNHYNNVLAELSHAKQAKDYALTKKLELTINELNAFIAAQKTNMSVEDAYDRTYDIPNTIENDAHSIMEPKLVQEFDYRTNRAKRSAMQSTINTLKNTKQTGGNISPITLNTNLGAMPDFKRRVTTANPLNKTMAKLLTLPQDTLYELVKDRFKNSINSDINRNQSYAGTMSTIEPDYSYVSPSTSRDIISETSYLPVQEDLVTMANTSDKNKLLMSYMKPLAMKQGNIPSKVLAEALKSSIAMPIKSLRKSIPTNLETLKPVKRDTSYQYNRGGLRQLLSKAEFEYLLKNLPKR